MNTNQENFHPCPLFGSLLVFTTSKLMISPSPPINMEGNSKGFGGHLKKSLGAPLDRGVFSLLKTKP